MNFLAHIELSGEDKDLLTGNFLGDFVSKKEMEALPANIQKGVLLHRVIDQFTDQHPVTKACNRLLHEKHGKYAAVLTDIFYDHFLAKHWQEFHHSNLNDFAAGIYEQLGHYLPFFPDRAKAFYQYMCHYNILYRYKDLEGIHMVLQGMARRSSYGKHMAQGISTLEEHYESFEKNFLNFYPELQQHTLPHR